VRKRVDVWRLHWEAPDKIVTRTASAPRYRFDDPLAEYAVTYANLDEVGAFLEVYGQTQRIGSTELDRMCTQLTSSRDLLLIDLEKAQTQKAFGLDARIASVLEYGATRLWSRAWHEWYTELDGIRYRSRQENDTLNLCLFLDRCSDALMVESSVRLEDIDRRELLGMVAPYRIVVEW
jgi:hypothetical protein